MADAAPPTASPVASTSRSIVQDGDNILLKLPSKLVKAFKIAPNLKISLGKYGEFKGAELIGKPYGETYEVDGEGKLQRIQASLTEIEETGASNEHILSTGAQKLSFVDIEALKAEGATGREIIQKQIDEHAAFDLKTAYSKEKYMKRKQAKYLQMFTPIEPNSHNLCEYHFERVPARTREIRPDTLALMLSMADVRQGARVLVSEDVHGLIVGAVLERLAGKGTLMVLNDADSPPDINIVPGFNFPPSYMDPMMSLHWGATEPDYVPPALPMEVAEDKVGSQREANKMRKRKAAYETAKRTRQTFFEGEFDAVILASQYEPYSVLSRLLPRMAGSANIAVYSQHLSTLNSLHAALRTNPEFIAPTLHEPWLRKYQVLPGRTHPEMNGMGHGGYLLSTTRVWDTVDVRSVTQRKKKDKSTAAPNLKRTREDGGDSEGPDKKVAKGDVVAEEATPLE